MASVAKFNIPIIDSIPTQLFQSYKYEKAFLLLGFKLSGFSYQRTYTNGKELIKVNIADNGFQWIVFLSNVFKNERTLVVPKEFSIQENLTLVEIIAIFSREWVKVYGQTDIPEELIFGYLYSEHIKNLKLSRPPKPIIVVERDYFRFIISKIKKELLNFDPNDVLTFSLKNEILVLSIGINNYSIPVSQAKNFTNEKISVLLNDFLEMVPKRFRNETVHLNMIKNGLLVDNHIIKVSWDGANIWEFDEYDDFLSKRLVHRSILFGG